MTKREITEVLALMKVTYPRFYQNIQSNDEVALTVNVWAEMFKDDSATDVRKAVNELICTLEYPPTIADVKNKIRKYEEDRRLNEYCKKRELEEQQERLMIEAKYMRDDNQSQKPRVDASKYIKDIKQKLFGEAKINEP